MYKEESNDVACMEEASVECMYRRDPHEFSCIRGPS